MPSLKRSAPVLRLKKFGNLKNLKNKSKVILSKGNKVIEKKPFTSFFVALGVLLLLIILGSTVFKTPVSKPVEKTSPKNVKVYSMGESPRISVQGEVKKSGVIKIVAQTPGIVSSINYFEGSEVAKGTVILSLASNYQGGNAISLQRQLAGVQYRNAKETYDIQKDIIQKQREIANKQDVNSDELRNLTKLSILDTEPLVNLNNELLNNIKTNMQTLENANADQSQIDSLRQVQAQLQAGTNQLNSALRSSQYLVNESNAPIAIENITREIALKQFDVQEKALKMGLEAAGIQLRLAQAQEAMMFPASPFPGTVQKIHVKVGELVNPGTPLITFAGYDGTVVVDAKVPYDLAIKLAQDELSIIEVDGKKISLAPSYVSTEATSGQLYSVIFAIGEEYRNYFTDSSYVTVTLPIGNTNGGSTIPFIPVDSVFQTQNEAFVYVVNGNKAKSKKVKLGPVAGRFVTVESGLSPNDKVILNRTVIDGDIIRINN